MKRFRKMSLCLACAVACPLALAVTNAGAQQATTTGAATVLFDEGVALMEKGKFAAACPKLARSNELSPNGGTLFALADCYEKNGQIASAWVTYKEAAIRANAAQRVDAEKKATDAAERLAPKVSKLSVQVPPASAVDGLSVTLDGRPMARPEWGIATPIDPGSHKVTASAPGRLPATREITFDAVAAQKVVTLPVLEAEPRAAADVVDEGAPRGRTQRVLGVVVGVVGLGGIAVGTIFGLSASSKNADAARHCRDGNLCDADGIRLDKEGRDAATISTIAFIAGGTLAATGIVLFLTAPRGAEKPASTASMGVRGTPGGAALTLGATF